jgi:hypothetical protein
MPQSAPWVQWIGWTLLFALAVWGISIVSVLLAERRQPNDLVPWIEFVGPLLVAFLIGLRIRSWWWVLGPPLATISIMLTYPLLDFLTKSPTSRRELGSALVLAVILTLLRAGIAMLAAGAGVLAGKLRFGG